MWGRRCARCAVLGTPALAMSLLLALAASTVAAGEENRGTTTSNGITVTFTARAVKEGAEGKPIVAGEHAEVRFKLTDAVTGTTISNAGPGVWIDAHNKVGVGVPKPGEAENSCREKIASFLQGGLSYRPDIDLNAWYILTLNSRGSITVIDPLRGYGGQRIITLIPLDSPGEDWVMGRDARSLFVALPGSDAVAVIDTAIWKVSTNIKVGRKPVRLVLQRDGRYLWTSHDGGISVIDTEKRAPAQEIATGPGYHDIALGKGDQQAFVSNPAAGTVSVIDVATLKVNADIQVGGSPGALAYSALADAIYVADAKSGAISAINATTHTVTARMQAKPGLYALQFTHDGRWGFSANPKADEVIVFDTSTNRIVNRIDVSGAPDQVTIGAKYAYVRATASEQVSLIALDSIGKPETAIVKTVPGGQQAPLADGQMPATAPVIVQTPDENTVLVANPSDKAIYLYSEGMNAPIGSFDNMRREMRAALAVDRSLRETEPGVYSGHFRVPTDGIYDVAFHMSSPPLSLCFALTAAADPQATARSAKAYRLEFLEQDRDFAAGDTVRLRLRLTDPGTAAPISDVTDLDVQMFLVPGIWRVLRPAKALGNGVYEVTFELPQAGVYYLNVASRSLNARYNDMPSLVLRAGAAKTPAGKG